MSDHQDQPSSQGQPSGYEEGRQAGQAGEKGQGDKGGKPRGEEPNPAPPTYTHPTVTHRATARHPQGPPWSQTGPPERGCVPAPAQQHARARSARNTQARQGTHAAPHASTHDGTKHDTTTAKNPRPTTNKPPSTGPSPAVPTAQQPRPEGRVCARQGTQPLLATKQPPSRRTCVRPAVNQAPAGYESATVRMDVCAPGSVPSPCRLQNTRRPDGRVCARQ